MNRSEKYLQREVKKALQQGRDQLRCSAHPGRAPQAPSQSAYAEQPVVQEHQQPPQRQLQQCAVERQHGLPPARLRRSS